MRRTAIAVIIALTVTGAARAQSLEDRLRSQLTATVSQLRDAKAGQADLAAQKARAEQERDALKAKLAAAEAKLRGARAETRPSPDASGAALDKAKAEQLALDQVQLDATVAENRRLTQQIAQLRTEHDQQAAQLTANTQSLAVCRAKHAEVVTLAKEILAAYDHVTGAGMLQRREPFTGLKRVQVQKLVQGFGDRLYDSRLDAQPKAPSTSPPAAPPPQSQTQ